MIDLDFSKGEGLIPVIVQDFWSGKVLMLAYTNRASWQKSIETGEAHYWSRSRRELWHKGESSGHVQRIREIYVDCDSDTLLIKVEQVGGAACHVGYETCFYRKLSRDGSLVEVGQRIFDPERVYKK